MLKSEEQVVGTPNLLVVVRKHRPEHVAPGSMTVAGFGGPT